LGQQGKTVRVTIFGEEYPIRGEADAEYMLKVAEYVDRSMRSVAEKAAHLSTTKVAVLTALNIADELFRERSDSQKQLTDVEEKAQDILEWLDARLTDESSP
jgi:cell division protein ZapA